MTSQFALSDHAKIRSQQRAIPLPIIEILMQYGRRCSAGRGCRLVYLDKKSLQRIHREFTDPILKAIEKKRNCYLVVAEDESIVTVGYRIKKILH